MLRDQAIIAELEKKIEGRLVPISGELVQPIDGIKNAENAIKNAEIETTNALRKYISALDDPTTFELLVSVLFRKLGYTNVVVTKRSGDGGIDVKAVLVVEGEYQDLHSGEASADPRWSPGRTEPSWFTRFSRGWDCCHVERI